MLYANPNKEHMMLGMVSSMLNEWDMRKKELRHGGIEGYR